jgi:general stress protein YciG
MKQAKQVSTYLANIGRKGGKASGKARMQKLTPERRSELARKAALARWKSKKAPEN